VSTKTRVALALGSGGARGYAHIGVLQVLRERDYEVVSIAGTSMGALVGGVAAAGVLDEYTEWALSLTQREVWRLLDPTISAPGAFRAAKILAKVNELLGGAQIEDLPIPFTAVATDLNARREVWFQRGPVDLAIRASIAIPSVITPVMINGRLLVDGGLMNPVPIEPTVSAIADLTLAVSLSGIPVTPAPTTPLKESSEPRPREEWAERLRRGAAGILDADRFRILSGRLASGRKGFVAEAAIPEIDPEAGILAEVAETAEATEAVAAAAASALDALPGDLGVRDLLNMSFDTMSALITRYRMASTPPDVLVTVPVNACRTMDFHRAAELVELGRTLTVEALEDAGY
jgi:NTE family protein